MSQDKLTKLARGMPCTVGLPNCDGGGETTVLAHYRILSLGSGIGKKPPSIFGAYACASCHDAIDSRRFMHDHSREKVRLAFAEGVMRTWKILIDKGVIRI